MLGAEHLVGIGIVNDAERHFSAAQQADGDAAVAVAIDKVCSTVDGIDDKNISAAIHLVRSLLLAEELRAGEQGKQLLPQQRFHCAVVLGHEIGAACFFLRDRADIPRGEEKGARFPRERLNFFEHSSTPPAVFPCTEKGGGAAQPPEREGTENKPSEGTSEETPAYRGRRLFRPGGAEKPELRQASARMGLRGEKNCPPGGAPGFLGAFLILLF
jgi:hypothetical protein